MVCVDSVCHCASHYSSELFRSNQDVIKQFLGLDSVCCIFSIDVILHLLQLSELVNITARCLTRCVVILLFQLESRVLHNVMMVLRLYFLLLNLGSRINLFLSCHILLFALGQFFIFKVLFNLVKLSINFAFIINLL